MSSSVLILLSAFFGACETALIRSIGTTHDFLELMTAQYLGVSALCTFLNFQPFITLATSDGQSAA